MLPDLNTDFSRGRSGGLVFSSVKEYSTAYCDPHSQRLDIVNKAETEIFLELSCFFNDTADIGNLISGSSAFSKTTEHLEFHGSFIAEAWLGDSTQAEELSHVQSKKQCLRFAGAAVKRYPTSKIRQTK